MVTEVAFDLAVMFFILLDGSDWTHEHARPTPDASFFVNDHSAGRRVFLYGTRKACGHAGRFVAMPATQ